MAQVMTSSASARIVAGQRTSAPRPQPTKVLRLRLQIMEVVYEA